MSERDANYWYSIYKWASAGLYDGNSEHIMQWADRMMKLWHSDNIRLEQ